MSEKAREACNGQCEIAIHAVGQVKMSFLIITKKLKILVYI